MINAKNVIKKGKHFDYEYTGWKIEDSNLIYCFDLMFVYRGKIHGVSLEKTVGVRGVKIIDWYKFSDGIKEFEDFIYNDYYFQSEYCRTATRELADLDKRDEVIKIDPMFYIGNKLLQINCDKILHLKEV